MSSTPIVPTVTPGQTPGATPPTFGQDSDATKQLLAMLQKAMTPRPQLQNPTAPAPIPQQKSTMPPGNMKRGQANMYTIGTALQNAAAMVKQKQVAEAESSWNELTTAIQKYIQPDGSISPQAYQDPAVMNVLGNPKTLKRMAKVFNQDWLNPKPDAFTQGYQQHMAKQQQKQQAVQGLKALFGHLIQKSQQPQLTPDQQRQMAQQVMSKAPIQQPTIDKNQAALAAKELQDEAAQAKLEEQQQYQLYRDEQKENFTKWQDQTREDFQSNMQRLRETAQDQREANREIEMMKALNIRLSDADKKKVSVPVSQINSEINGTLTTFRQQLSQASTSLRTLQSQAQKRSGSMWQKMISDEPDVAGAQSQVKNMQAAVDYIEKNRAAVLSGKMSLDDVIDQAEKKATGTVDLSDLGGK